MTPQPTAKEVKEGCGVIALSIALRTPVPVPFGIPKGIPQGIALSIPQGIAQLASAYEGCWNVPRPTMGSLRMAAGSSRGLLWGL